MADTLPTPRLTDERLREVRERLASAQAVPYVQRDCDVWLSEAAEMLLAEDVPALLADREALRVDAEKWRECQVGSEAARRELAQFRGLVEKIATLKQQWHEERERRVTAEQERHQALSLLDEVVDDEPCRYDHHGYCQSHNLNPRPCPHALALEMLEAVEMERLEEQSADALRAAYLDLTSDGEGSDA